jgi:transcriptional regulator with XRE-family HTH domain
MNIALKIKELRTNKGISVQQMADRLGVTRQAIYDWESARRQPTVKKIQQIAEILEVSPDEILKAMDPPLHSTSFRFDTSLEMLLEEYKAREKQYLETIFILTQQLGKFAGDSVAVVATNRRFWLQSGSHYVRMAS